MHSADDYGGVHRLGNTIFPTSGGHSRFFSFSQRLVRTDPADGMAFHRNQFFGLCPPYIYLLNIVHTAFPTMGNLDAVKLPSILADCATVLLGTGIVYTATKSWPASSFAFAALMFAPTVFINSAYWGQSDSILAACILACLWCLLHQKPTLAILAFGLAFSFKLQAVFLAPFLLAMVVMGYIPKKSLLGFPIPIFLSYLPAWLAGRPLIHLLSIYPMQTNRYKFLTFNAATAFSWFSKADYDTVAPAGILLAGGICFLYITLAFFRRKPDLEWREGVLLATLSCLIVPFFLPSMHDRYFYLVDVLTILLAFCYPRLFYIPILSQLISLATYHYSLFSSEVLPLPILGLGEPIPHRGAREGIGPDPIPRRSASSQPSGSPRRRTSNPVSRRSRRPSPSPADRGKSQQRRDFSSAPLIPFPVCGVHKPGRAWEGDGIIPPF